MANTTLAADVLKNIRKLKTEVTVDLIHLEDRTTEVRKFCSETEHTIDTFNESLDDVLKSNIDDGAKSLALKTLMDEYDGIDALVEAMNNIFTESVIFASPTRATEAKKLQNRLNRLFKKVEKAHAAAEG